MKVIKDKLEKEVVNIGNEARFGRTPYADFEVIL